MWIRDVDLTPRVSSSSSQFFYYVIGHRSPGIMLRNFSILSLLYNMRINAPMYFEIHIYSRTKTLPRTHAHTHAHTRTACVARAHIYTHKYVHTLLYIYIFIYTSISEIYMHIIR